MNNNMVNRFLSSWPTKSYNTDSKSGCRFVCFFHVSPKKVLRKHLWVKCAWRQRKDGEFVQGGGVVTCSPKLCMSGVARGGHYQINPTELGTSSRRIPSISQKYIQSRHHGFFGTFPIGFHHKLDIPIVLIRQLLTVEDWKRKTNKKLI